MGGLPEIMSPIEFDDFLGLAGRDFSRHRVIAFVGRSGSGKSTAIRFLVRNHPDFQGQNPVVIDEAASRRAFRELRPAIRAGARFLIATHLQPWAIRTALPMPGVAILRTDTDPAKLARHLQKSGVAASANAIRAYVQAFGASYSDLDIILERFPGRSFDEALARFQRFCRSECNPPAGPFSGIPAAASQLPREIDLHFENPASPGKGGNRLIIPFGSASAGE